MIFDRGNNMVKVVFYKLTIKTLTARLFMKLLQTSRGNESGDCKSGFWHGKRKQNQ